MLLSPFLHPNPQTTPFAQANRNHHRRPWPGLRILALCLTITLSLGLIQPALAVLVWQIQIVDNAGFLGANSSLVLDSNSHPVISYYDFLNGTLKLAHCGDTTCSSGNTIVTIDHVGDLGLFGSLALDSNGNPVISYADTANGALKLVRCGDATCSSGNTIRMIDSPGVTGWYNSLALDSSGNPVISYRDSLNRTLKLAHCGDATCSSGNTFVTLDSIGNGGAYTSLALDSNGNPVISYYSNRTLKLVHCGDPACSSGNSISTVDSAGDVGWFTSLALDSNGNPVISYLDFANYDLKLAYCGDATCSSGNTIRTLDSNGLVGEYTSLALDSSGNPVIGYFDFDNGDLKMVHCGDATCGSGNTIQIVDGAGYVGETLSLALDSSSNPVISYFKGSGSLNVARLVDDPPPSVIVNQSSGQADPTNSNPLLFSATFSEDVTGFTNAAVTLNGTANLTSASITVSGGPREYTISVSGLAGNGTVIATVAAAAPGVTDAVGNSNTASTSTDNSVTFFSDNTPPILNPVVSPNPVMLGGTATVTAGATDALSGVASESCGALDTSSVGIKTVTCTATDNAGNSASATVNYTVAYPWTGFFQPVDNLPTVNTVNAGQAIPGKFSLGGDFGLNIFASGYPASQKVSCGSSGSGGSTSPIEETVTPGNSTLQYNAATQSYTYVWKTDKAWAGACRQLIIRLIDGTDHIAFFQFNGKVRSADAEGEAEVVQRIFLPLVNR